MAPSGHTCIQTPPSPIARWLGIVVAPGPGESADNVRGVSRFGWMLAIEPGASRGWVVDDGPPEPGRPDFRVSATIVSATPDGDHGTGYCEPRLRLREACA